MEEATITDPSLELLLEECVREGTHLATPDLMRRNLAMGNDWEDWITGVLSRWRKRIVYAIPSTFVLDSELIVGHIFCLVVGHHLDHCSKLCVRVIGAFLDA